MLFRALSGSQDSMVRGLAAVLIRKRITKTLYEKLNPQMQEAVKNVSVVVCCSCRFSIFLCRHNVSLFTARKIHSDVSRMLKFGVLDADADVIGAK
jgi:hypothetical protein